MGTGQNTHMRQKDIFSKIAERMVVSSTASFAVMVSLLILWNQYNSRVTLTILEMNVIFFVMFAISLILTVWTRENRKKCLCLIGILVAIIEVLFYNWENNAGNSFFLDFIRFGNGYNNLWSKLLLLMLIYLAVVGMRVILWSQKEWEELQNSNREKRRKKKEVFWEACKKCWINSCEKRKWKRAENWTQKIFKAIGRRIKQKTKAEMQEQRGNASKEKQETKLEHKKKLQALRHKKEREAAEKDYIMPIETKAISAAKSALVIGIMAAFFALYLLLPICSVNREARAKNWIDYVTQFMQGIGYNVNTDKTATILAQYTVFFIAFIGMLYISIALLYRLVKQFVDSFFSKSDVKRIGLSHFFDEYSTAVSVLIVATATLSTFSGNDAWTFDKLPELFKNMVCIVLVILLAMIAIDAVRLILEQCVNKGTLLRTSMHLTFALLVDCVMGIVIGVITELNIRGLLSSLLTFLLQGNQRLIYDKAESILDEALNEEMKIIVRDRRMQQGTINMQRKNVSRKQNGRRKSAFSNFYKKNNDKRR